MRILVVEDEKKVASFIQRGLEEEGFSVDVAYEGVEGVAIFLLGKNSFLVISIESVKPTWQ